MATRHMLNDRVPRGNLCDGYWQGYSTWDINRCNCVDCLRKLLNDALMKIDELEDDLMVSNRTIAVLSAVLSE